MKQSKQTIKQWSLSSDCGLFSVFSLPHLFGSWLRRPLWRRDWSPAAAPWKENLTIYPDDRQWVTFVHIRSTDTMNCNADRVQMVGGNRYCWQVSLMEDCLQWIQPELQTSNEIQSKWSNLETHSSSTSPSPLISLTLPVSSSNSLLTTDWRKSCRDKDEINRSEHRESLPVSSPIPPWSWELFSSFPLLFFFALPPLQQ